MFLVIPLSLFSGPAHFIVVAVRLVEGCVALAGGELSSIVGASEMILGASE